MTDIAIAQLLWAVWGVVVGWLAALAWAGYRGWFDRKIDIKTVAEINLPAFIDGIAPALAKGVAAMQPHHHIHVDWNLIHAVVEREGYMLIAKPTDAEHIARKN